MPPNRGTDLSTEQRQLRPRTEKDALGKWLDALFYATAEVVLMSLPLLLFVMFTGDLELVFTTIVAVTTLVLAVGGQRHRPLGPPWPRITPRSAVARVVLYNVALAVGLGIGRVAFSEPMVSVVWVGEPIVAPSLVAVGVVLAVVVAVPYLSVWLGQGRRG